MKNVVEQMQGEALAKITLAAQKKILADIEAGKLSPQDLLEIIDTGLVTLGFADGRILTKYMRK